MKQKKPSLFKQHANKVKSQSEQGFPEAIELPKEEPKKETSDPQEVKSGPQKPSGLMTEMSQSGLVGAGEMEEISRKNWEQIDAMSPEQRQRMVDMIRTQMPTGFVSQLEHKFPAPNVEEQEEKGIAQDEQTLQQEESQDWHKSLRLKIDDNTLHWDEQETQTMISIEAIALMVGSENNQSQVVGARLAKTMTLKLEELASAKSRELVFVDQVPLHLGMLFESITRKALLPIIKQASNTTFRSAFIELIAALAEICIKVAKYISPKSSKILRQNIGKVSVRMSQFDIQQEQKQQIKDSLNLVVSQLGNSTTSLADSDWASLTKSAGSILSLSLIEIAYRMENSYIWRVCEAVDKSADLDEVIQIGEFLFEFINLLILKKLKDPMVNIKEVREAWSEVLTLTVLKMTNKLHNLSIEAGFKCCFLARFVGGQLWENLTKAISFQQELKHPLTHCLLLNTLSDFKASTISEEQTEAINAAMNWLSSHLSANKNSFVNPNYILNLVLQLFLEDEEYYSTLSQSVLQVLLKSIYLHPQFEAGLTLTEDKLRKLIENYAFNSYGNECFTLYLLMVLFEQTAPFDDMVLRESVLRYPSAYIEVSLKLQSWLVPNNKHNERKGDLFDQKRQVLDSLTETYGNFQGPLWNYLQE